MEAVQRMTKNDSNTLSVRDLTKEELGDALRLFVHSIRRVRLCGEREIINGVIYYEKNIRNSGLWLSATSFKSPKFENGVQYYISVSSDSDEDTRQWIIFDCTDSLAIVSSCSDDVSILIGACNFLKSDFSYVLWRIENYKD